MPELKGYINALQHGMKIKQSTKWSTLTKVKDLKISFKVETDPRVSELSKEDRERMAKSLENMKALIELKKLGEQNQWPYCYIGHG